jgi:hypothetical protein
MSTDDMLKKNKTYDHEQGVKNLIVLKGSTILRGLSPVQKDAIQEYLVQMNYDVSHEVETFRTNDQLISPRWLIEKAQMMQTAQDMLNDKRTISSIVEYSRRQELIRSALQDAKSQKRQNNIVVLSELLEVY